MSASSMATARLMETWAHGLDVADALGVTRPATARLRSIAHIGVRTRDFAFVINGLQPPSRTVPGGAARTRRRPLDVGPGRRGPARHRRPPRTSAFWSPSAGAARSRPGRRRRRRGALAADRAGLRGSAGRRSMSAQRESALRPAAGADRGAQRRRPRCSRAADAGTGRALRAAPGRSGHRRRDDLAVDEHAASGRGVGIGLAGAAVAGLPARPARG